MMPIHESEDQRRCDLLAIIEEEFVTAERAEIEEEFDRYSYLLKEVEPLKSMNRQEQKAYKVILSSRNLTVDQMIDLAEKLGAI